MRCLAFSTSFTNLESRMRRIRILVSLVLVSVLSACQPSLTFRPTPFSPRVETNTQDVAKAVGLYYTWVGTTLGQSGFTKMRLEYQLFESAVEGQYAIGCISTNSLNSCGINGRGLIIGTIQNGILDAQLKVNTDCVYTLFGSVTAEKIIATVEPSYCPGGTKAEWELRRG